MARKPQSAASGSEPSDRDRIVAALMSLLAERRYDEIGFGDLAARAELPLHRCRAEFDSLISVIAAHMDGIDRTILAGIDPDMAQEPPRERLFDVLMRRMEALAPHRQAIRSLMRSARCNPPLALALNGLAVRSQRWMLAAADIDSAGLRGAMRAQGLACLYADVLRVWVDDDDPGLSRSMAALDRALSRGAHWARLFDDVCRLVPRCPSRSYRRRPQPDDGMAEQPAVV